MILCFLLPLMVGNGWYCRPAEFEFEFAFESEFEFQSEFDIFTYCTLRFNSSYASAEIKM